MATRYWYKNTTGAANWATTTNWYTSPNGVGALGAVPANTDDIVVDPSVNNIGTLNIEAAKTCNSFVSTGFPGGITGTFALNVTTNTSRGQSASTPLFTLPTNPSTYTYSGTITFAGSAGGGHIYCNGNSFKGPIICSTGTTTFADVFSSTAAVTLNATTDIKSNFLTTSTIAQGTSGVLYLSGSSLTATTTTISHLGYAYSNLSITGSLTITAGVGLGTLYTATNATTICTGTTTLTGASYLYSRGAFTSNAVTITNGTISHTTLNAGPFTCTNVLTLTAGFLTSVVSFTNPVTSNDIYIGSLTTSGTGGKDFHTTNLYLTGIGSLYTPGTGTNLNTYLTNVYIVNSSANTKTLTATSLFPLNASLYLAGSGSGTITLAPSTFAIPDVYVACTGPTPVSFSTGVVNNLTFTPGTRANWSQSLASQTLTVVYNLTLTGSMTSSLTPSLLFNQGNMSYVTMAGKSLVTGTLTVNNSNQTMYFVDDFNTNAAVAFTDSSQCFLQGNFTCSTLTNGNTSYAYVQKKLTTSTITLTAGIGAPNYLSVGIDNYNIPYPNASISATTITLSTNSPQLELYAGAITASAITVGGTGRLYTTSSGNYPTILSSSGAITINGTATASFYGGELTCSAITATGKVIVRNSPINCVGAFTGTGVEFSLSGSSTTPFTCLTFSAGTNSTSSFGENSRIIITGTDFTQGNTTYMPQVGNNSSIEFINTSNSTTTFAGGGLTYADLIFNRGASAGINAVNNGNTFTNLRDLGTAAHTMSFGVASTTTLTGTFDVKGSPGKLVSIVRSATTSATSVQKGYLSGSFPYGAGLVVCDYVAVSGIRALDYTGNTASGIWFAGPNSTIISSVGWETTGSEGVPIARKLGAGGVG